MTRHACEVAYRLRFTETRVFCGAGVGTGGVDRTFIRDAYGRTFVPGSHVKGLVRERCEQLFETMTGRATHDPHLPGLVKTDLVTRTFGAPGGHDLRCVFANVVPGDATPTRAVSRAQVRMNRLLGRPETGALFDTEFALTATRGAWRGTVRLWADGPSQVPPELGLLCAGLRLVDAVGGTRSTGAGSVVIEIESVRVDGGTVDLPTVLDALDASSAEGGTP
jgi:CRISPR/Cas system CSM-associated protein Csm3 (group 7 of RAMP superfamily)